MLKTMLRSSFLGALCAASLYAGMSTPAHAGFLNLGPAGDFNVFVFGNNTQTGSDAEGRVAVGGNADFTGGTSWGGFTVASSMGKNTDNLIVGGNLTTNGHTLKGNAIVGGNMTWKNVTISGNVAVNGDANFLGGGGEIKGTISVAGEYKAPNYYKSASKSTTALPFSFSEVQTYLTDQSNYLASLAETGTTVFKYGLILTATDPNATFVTFNVTGEQMAAAKNYGLTINAPKGATVVVNVSGAATSMESMGITLKGVDKQHVLYNFSEATSLTISSIGVQGTILAPLATVKFNNGNIDGTLIVNNLSGTGESHNFLFQGNLPSAPVPDPVPTNLGPVVPEPSSLALAAFGLAAIGGRYLRRQKAA